MEDIDYREIMYRLEKILEKKKWSDKAKTNMRKTIQKIIENNDEYIEVLGQKEKVNKKKYISDLLNQIERDVLSLKYFTGDLVILNSGLVAGLNVKEEDKYNIYVKSIEEMDTSFVLQHELGHNKRNNNLAGVRLGEITLKKLLDEAIAVESENKVMHIKESKKNKDNYLFYSLNKQLYYMIGEMLYDEKSKDLIGNSIDSIEKNYSSGKIMQNYWQNLIAFMIKYGDIDIYKVIEGQKDLFQEDTKEYLEEQLEVIGNAAKEEKKETDKINDLVLLENIEGYLKIKKYIKDNNLKQDEFKEFNDGVIQSYYKGIIKNIAEMNSDFFSIMFAKIDKMQNVEEIYNEIIKLKEIENICEFFEELVGRKGKMEHFYKKIDDKIKTLRNQGKITILPEKEER